MIEGEERAAAAGRAFITWCASARAVTNALRHASPQTVKNSRWCTASYRISMTVRDNGTGFRPPESPQATPGPFRARGDARTGRKKLGGRSADLFRLPARARSLGGRAGVTPAFRLKVLLVEDHFLARVALRSVLNGRFDVCIAARPRAANRRWK